MGSAVLNAKGTETPLAGNTTVVSCRERNAWKNPLAAVIRRSIVKFTTGNPIATRRAGDEQTLKYLLRLVYKLKRDWTMARTWPAQATEQPAAWAAHLESSSGKAAAHMNHDTRCQDGRVSLG